jgi:hypothetical protein
MARENIVLSLNPDGQKLHRQESVLRENGFEIISAATVELDFHRQPTSGTEGCSDSLGRGKLPSALPASGISLSMTNFGMVIPSFRSFTSEEFD